MKVILTIALMAVLGTASAQVEVQFTKKNRPYATTDIFTGSKGEPKGSTWTTQKLNMYYANFGDLMEESFVAYFSFKFFNDMDVPEGSNVLLKLGNDSLINVQTADKSYAKYVSSSVYRCSFYVSLDSESAEEIATHGIKKVRLAFSDLKIDWTTDKSFEKSKNYARLVLDADLKVSVASDNDDF